MVFMQQRGLHSWPSDGNITTPLCVVNDCSCCFADCPSYTLQFITVQSLNEFEVQWGASVTLASSCVVPSIAADKSKVFVLTSSALEMYTHQGQKIFSWQNNQLEYRGPWHFAADLLQDPWSKQGNQWYVRMGGQIALDNSGVATEVYFTTVHGHLFYCAVADDAGSSQVTALVQSEKHSFIGAALQTYTVPNEDLQKRLYVTRVSGNGDGFRGTIKEQSIERININALLKWVRANGAVRLPVCVSNSWKTPCDQRLKPPTKNDDAEQWKHFSKTVNAVTPRRDSRFSRLAYADGKLYYLLTAKEKRATLRSADVTLFVDCDEAFALTNQSFHNWVIPPEDYEQSFEATPGQPRYEDLHETSKYAGTFPWEFRAFKKVVPWYEHLVVKEMLCSKPKPPTTRPSQEKCCVRKRIESNVASALNKNGQCKIADLIKQL